jgi:hypothetical protein
MEGQMLARHDTQPNATALRVRARARGARFFLTDGGNTGPCVGFCRAQDDEPLSTINNDDQAARWGQTQLFSDNWSLRVSQKELVR